MAPYCFADGRNKNSEGERLEVRLHPLGPATQNPWGGASESRFMARLGKRYYALIFNPDAMTVTSKM
jgi:hypothetical protein